MHLCVRPPSLQPTTMPGREISCPVMSESAQDAEQCFACACTPRETGVCAGLIGRSCFRGCCFDDDNEDDEDAAMTSATTMSSRFPWPRDLPLTERINCTQQARSAATQEGAHPPTRRSQQRLEKIRARRAERAPLSDGPTRPARARRVRVAQHVVHAPGRCVVVSPARGALGKKTNSGCVRAGLCKTKSCAHDGVTSCPLVLLVHKEVSKR